MSGQPARPPEVHARFAIAALERSHVVEYLHIDPDGRVAGVNAAFARHIGRAPEDVIGTPASQFLSDADVVLIDRLARGRVALPDAQLLVRFVTRAGHVYPLRCTVMVAEDGLRLAGEPEAGGVEALRQMHPRPLHLCMACGRVETAPDRWETMLDFLRAYQILFSHGHCPDCARTMNSVLNEFDGG